MGAVRWKRARLDPYHLSREHALPRAIQLGKKNALPVAQKDGAFLDGKRQVVPQEHGTDVRIGVFPITVGAIFAIMEVTVFFIGESLEEGFGIRHERRLELIDEERGGGM